MSIDAYCVPAEGRRARPLNVGSVSAGKSAAAHALIVGPFVGLVSVDRTTGSANHTTGDGTTRGALAATDQRADQRTTGTSPQRARRSSRPDSPMRTIGTA